MKKAIHVGEILYPEKLRAHLRSVLDWKNITIEKVYGAEPFLFEDMWSWIETFGAKSDLSELALGWATYNADHMSMYGVNAGVPKTLVRHLVRHVADSSLDRKSVV